MFSLFPPDNATGNFVRVVQRACPNPVCGAGELPESYSSGHVGGCPDR